MGESAQHQKLVRMIIDSIEEMVGNDQSCFIESDIADGRPLPQLTQEGFRPDVIFQYNDRLIIGEAKTSNDVDTIHSKQQYESYIRKCSLFQGNAMLIIAVLWTEYATIYNIINRIKKQYVGTYSIKYLKGIGI